MHNCKRAISIAQHIETQVQPGDRIFNISAWFRIHCSFVCLFLFRYYSGPSLSAESEKLKVSVERLNVMIEDSQPTLILTSTLINTVIKSIQVKDNIQKRLGKVMMRLI